MFLLTFPKAVSHQGSSQPEAIYGIFRNVDATTAVAGYTTCMALTTPNAPGIDVDQCGTTGAVINSVVGVWIDTPARSKYGRVQIYGYCPTVYVGLSSVTAGDPLRAIDSASYASTMVLGQSGPGDADDYDNAAFFAVAMEASETTTAANIAGFIKAM